MYQPKVVAKFGHIQIYNPVGSGVIVLLDTMEVSSPDISAFTIRRTATEIGINEGVWISQLSNGVDGNADIRRDTETVVTGFILGYVYLTASTPYNFIPPGGIQIVEGLGYSVSCETLDTLYCVYFSGREV